MTLEFTVEGEEVVSRYLERFEQPELGRRLQRVATAGAGALVRPIREEAKRSFRGHGRNPGLLAKSVRARRGRRDRPSVVVGPTAPHRHLVIRGTRPHIIKPRTQPLLYFNGRWWAGAVNHPGARPNPFVERAVERERGRFIEGVRKHIQRQLIQK